VCLAGSREIAPNDPPKGNAAREFLTVVRAEKA